MAIPRRILVIAAGALATGAVLYVRNKMREQKERQQSQQGAPQEQNNPAKESK